MKLNKTQLVLYFWCIVGIVGTCISIPLYLNHKDSVHYRNLMMAFVTICWNFNMRLLLGIFLIIPKYNPESWVFKITKHDRKVHNFLKIKKWVTKCPTFNPDQYDSKKLSLDEIIQNTCKNEISHKVYYVITWMAILLSIPFGNWLMTVIIAAIVCQNDVLLIHVQKFSRDRLNKLNKRAKRTQK